MTRRRAALIAGGVLILAAAAWGLMLGLERVMGGGAGPAPSTGPAEPSAAPQRHINATLFYGSPDGTHLVAVPREVPYGETPVEQGRQILLAQLNLPAPPRLVAPVPPGATLRRFYVTERGDAFVDLGPEIVTAHPGGSTAELFTVYAIVNAITANLPAITRVQILIDGREVDTLAGHVDLRRPLQRNETLVRTSSSQ